MVISSLLVAAVCSSPVIYRVRARKSGFANTRSKSLWYMEAWGVVRWEWGRGDTLREGLEPDLDPPSFV